MHHLLSALEAIAKIGEDGVIERRETGKPTWSALDAIKNIAREAIAKHTSESTILIIDADVVQRIVDEDMAGITIHAKLSDAGIDLEAYSGEDELVASNCTDIRNAGCNKCGMNDRADDSDLCDACLDDAQLSAEQLKRMLANHDEFELAIVGRKYAEIRTQLAEMGYPVDIQVVMVVVDKMASSDPYFVRLAKTVSPLKMTQEEYDESRTIWGKPSFDPTLNQRD